MERTLQPNLTLSYFNPKHFAAGQKITYSGFAGSIVGHYSEGMWEVRLPGGVACVSGAHIVAASGSAA